MITAYLCELARFGWLEQADKDLAREKIAYKRESRLMAEGRCECGCALNSDGECPSCLMDTAELLREAS